MAQARAVRVNKLRFRHSVEFRGGVDGGGVVRAWAVKIVLHKVNAM